MTRPAYPPGLNSGYARGFGHYQRHQHEAAELAAGRCLCQRCLEYLARRRANGEPPPVEGWPPRRA
jgi:hypothetical protein